MIIEFQGQRHEFPDDFSQEQISAALKNIGFKAPPARSLGQLGGDVALSVANGATFGFAGEGLAAGQTVLGMGKPSYGENLADWQAREKEIPPQIKIPGEIAGGVAAAAAAAPLAGPAAAATGLAKVPAWMRYAGAGVAGGALYGAGEAEPDQRLEGAGKGAAIGLAAGLGVSAIGKTGKEVYGAIAPNSVVTADLARALVRDGDTPQALVQRFVQADSLRPGEATVLDVAGKNLRGLAERIAQTPGAGLSTIEPFLTSRQLGQLNRITDDLKSLTGVTKDAYTMAMDVMAQRKADAGPLYKEAMNFNARENADIVREWSRITDTGWGKSILYSDELKKNLQTEYGIRDINNAPLMVLIDAWKKAADDVVSRSMEREGARNTARVVGDMRDSFIQLVDKHNPAYSIARDKWSGHSRYLDAIKEGRDIFNTKISPEELAAAVRAMPDAEREGFRIGAVSAIVSKMKASDGAWLADSTRQLRNSMMREKVAAIMPDDASRAAWSERLNFEVNSSSVVGQSLKNSATARRLAQREDAESLAGDLVLEAFAGSPPISLIRKMAGVIPAKVRDTLRSRSDGMLADMLTTHMSDPQGMQALVNAMNRVTQKGAPPSVLRTSAAITGANAGIIE